MSEKVPDYVVWSDKLAVHAFKVMRLYCREYGLPKEIFVDALATLCVDLRATYPDGTAAFDELARAAQERYERKKKT